MSGPRSVWLHAVALALAIPAAYLTWTRDPDAVAKIGATLMWNGATGDVLAVELHNRAIDLVVSPRTDDGAYLWGNRVRHVTTAQDSSFYSQLLSLPDSVGFRVGDSEGREVMSLAAAPAAMRDLGPVADSLVTPYGFAEDTSLVRVVFPDRTEEMLIGGLVYGSEDRYAMRLSNRRVYVLPAAGLNLLRAGDIALTDRRYHTFSKDSIAALRITTPRATRTWAAASVLGSTVQYAPPDSLAAIDVDLSNLLGQLDEAGVTGYRAEIDPAGLTPLMRAEYLQADSTVLGFLEVYERPGKDGMPEHFIRTEHTRVFAQTYEAIAMMIRSNLDRVF